jgi:hypothetical protein
LAIAFRRKRAWLQLVAERSLLVPSRRLVGVAGDDRIQAQQQRVINPRWGIARHLEKW